jgi:hypothetical protein
MADSTIVLTIMGFERSKQPFFAWLFEKQFPLWSL